MAAPFLTHTDPARKIPARPSRPQLVVIEGGHAGRSTVDPARSAQRPSAAVYRRRRLVVALLVAVVVASAASVASSTLSDAGAGGPAVAATTYEVGAGDTLWSIATSLDLDADRREVVQLLADANGGTVVRPGQRLVIPAEVVALGS